MATITGTQFNDVLVGKGTARSPIDDYIYGLAGNDAIEGRYGNDTIEGGDGNDTIYGDTINHNSVRGGADRIFGGKGDDTIYAGGGNDVIVASEGTTADRDIVFGGHGNDWMFTGNGNDFLSGGVGNDTLRAGGGDDTLVGNTGHDTLVGHSGNDLLIGYHTVGTQIRDIDTLSGGSGADIFALGNSTGIAYLGIGYAVITDFEKNVDDIRVHGNLFEYTLGHTTSGGKAQTNIFKGTDLLAVVQNVHVEYSDLVGA
ncbi:MAG: calcium-binding protein [Cyanobacteria bacterium P01_B01_bin.77]